MRLIILIILISTFIHSGTWKNNGPFGAKITSIAVDPLDSTIVYAGTYGKGIYKSVDSGDHWFLINNGFPEWNTKTIGSPTSPSWWFGDHFPVNTIVIRKDSNQYIYAGLSGGGITFSKDHGHSWTSLNNGLPDSSEISVIWINPKNASILLCGLKYPANGLYKSVNGGSSWSFVSTVRDNNGFINELKDIKHNPLNPDSVYVSIGHTLYLSVDNGLSWQIINQQSGFDRLLILKDDPKHILAIVDTGYEDNVLMHSTDGGYNWDYFPQGAHWGYISALDEDINGTIYVYRQDVNELWISRDTGSTWDSHPLISDFGEFRAEPFSISPFAISPHNPWNIYFGTQAGFFKSENGGADYILKENGMINSYINTVAANPENPDIVYAGGDNGFWKTENNGRDWQRLSLMNVNTIAIDKTHPDTLYIGGDSLLRSFDCGFTFDLLMPNAIISEIEIHPNLNNTILVGIYPSTVKKSDDFGSTWNMIFSPEYRSFQIKDIKFHQTNDSLVYFGTDYNQNDHGLFKSTNMGESWDRISDPGLVKSVVLSAANEDTLWVCTSNTIQVSHDGGHTFTVLFDSISTHMSSLFRWSADIPKLLATTKDKGGFELDLKTQTYKTMQGEYDPRISAMDMSSGQNVWFATHGSGVWLGKDIITTINKSTQSETVPSSFHISGNYPNPFNNGTNIQIRVYVPTKISVRIFSVSGQLIKQLPGRKYLEGTHSIYWDGLGTQNKTASSGLYIVSVSDGTVTRYHKIILLK
ncbi:MAG: T9SS C-terminal target domain-containing protein [Calditrichaeota bacterium]|nr:MAG: T9SS C-terminal target domain-containing protein [Calditrichota bacterium]